MKRVRVELLHGVASCIYSYSTPVCLIESSVLHLTTVLHNQLKKKKRLGGVTAASIGLHCYVDIVLICVFLFHDTFYKYNKSYAELFSLCGNSVFWKRHIKPTTHHS